MRIKSTTKMDYKQFEDKALPLSMVKKMIVLDELEVVVIFGAMMLSITPILWQTNLFVPEIKFCMLGDDKVSNLFIRLFIDAPWRFGLGFDQSKYSIRNLLLAAMKNSKVCGIWSLRISWAIQAYISSGLSIQTPSFRGWTWQPKWIAAEVISKSQGCTCTILASHCIWQIGGIWHILHTRVDLSKGSIPAPNRIEAMPDHTVQFNLLLPKDRITFRITTLKVSCIARLAISKIIIGLDVNSHGLAPDMPIKLFANSLHRSSILDGNSF